MTGNGRAEEDIDRTAEDYEALVKNIPDAIYSALLDEKGTIVYASDRLGEWTGYSPADFYKDPGVWLRSIHPEDRDKASGVYVEACRKKDEYVSEYRIVHKDTGEIRYLSEHGVPVRDDKGGIIRFDGIVTDITERKTIEEELRKSEENYRLISENIPVVVYSALPDGYSTNLFVSGRIMELTGYSGTEFLESPELWRDIVYPDDREYVWEKIEEHREKKIPLEIEYRIITKSNEIKWIEDKAIPMLDENGRITRINGFMGDITERKRTEESLRESEERYRTLFESKLDGVCVIDESMKLLLANQAAANIFGLDSVEEILDVNPLDFISPEERERLLKIVTKDMFEDNLRQVNEFRFMNKAGEEVWIDAVGSVIEYQGKQAGSVSFRDITKRRRAEVQKAAALEALEKSEDRYRTTFESTGTATVIIEEDATLSMVNSQFEKISDYSREEIEGKKSWVEFVGKDDLERMMEYHRLRRIDEKAAPTNYEFHFVDRYGKVKDILLTAAMIPGTKKSVASLLDITDRKQAEEEIKRYSEHLEELVEERTRGLKEAERMAAIGETTIMVGHDLRNPLQAIVNNIYLAKKKAASLHIPEEELKVKQGLQNSLEMIGDRVKYMNKIVLDLQDYAGLVKSKLVKTDMKKLIDDIISTIRIPETVKTSTKIEKLGELLVDPELLRRTVTNLVTNAVQAMPKGGRLTIRLSKKNQDALISVRDTGVGISEENIEKIFNPLFTTKSQGQGFGLPVCRRLVEAHGGSLSVESEVGKGSTFTVRVPLVVG